MHESKLQNISALRQYETTRQQKLTLDFWPLLDIIALKIHFPTQIINGKISSVPYPWPRIQNLCKRT